VYSELIAEVTVETGRSSAMAGGKEGGGRLGKKTTRGRRADVQRPLDVAPSHSSPHRARARKTTTHYSGKGKSKQKALKQSTLSP
jgi:hypothetical protein